MRLWSKITQLFLQLVIGSIFSSTSYGQTDPNKTYFTKSNEECDSINAIGYRKVVYSFENEKSIQTVQTFRMNGTLESEKITIIKSYPKNSSTQLESTQEPFNFNNKYAKRKNYDSSERLMEIQHVYLDNLEGAFEKFYPDGSLKAKGSYHLNTYDDTLKGYYPNGVLKRIDVYCKGDLIEGKRFGTDGQDTTYFPFYQQASFPGELKDFNQYLMNNMKYPQVAMENNIQGRCYVKFLVHPDGSISNATLVRGIPGCPECDLEALRLIKKMPNWVPAIDEEQLANLASYYQISINFRLE